MRSTILAITFLAACGAPQDDAASDYDSIGIDDGKADSFNHPTERGSLELLTARTEKLDSHGVDRYVFVGEKNWKVSFTAKSGRFEPYLLLTGPNNYRHYAYGKRDASNGAWYASFTVTLPASAKYQVYVASVPRPAHGEYTLSADASVFCGGIAAFQCPSYLKCMLDGNYPDAGGSCQLPTACHTPADCDNLPHILCLGYTTCSAGRTGLGTCGYTCGDPCSGLSVDQCNANSECQVVAEGCNPPPPCDPELGCHPCDPIAVCKHR